MGAIMRQLQSMGGWRESDARFGRGGTLARFRWLLVVLGLLASGPLQARASSGGPPAFHIVESVPEATDYGDASTLRTASTWRAMIDGAQQRIDIAAFYLSDKPDGPLSPILDALRKKAGAGVRVRILVDQSFLKDNGDAVAKLRGVPGIVVRELPVHVLTGGVLHAKYMVVDGKSVFVGSQNWDWRALDQIHEVGAWIVDSRLGQTFDAVFDFDWRLAADGDLPKAAIEAAEPPAFAPVTDSDPVRVDDADGHALSIFPAFSPPSLMPRWVSWEQPELAHFIERTQHVLRIQVMTLSAIRQYGPKGWWPALDTAIRDAAARGVEVRIIVADWALREPMRDYLKSLAALPHITIKFTRVPPAPEGFIPYARVEHAKYAVFDDRSAFIGTGNWEWSYFNNTVDASVFVQGSEAAQTLARIFDRDWNGPYATPLTLDSHESAPRNH
jgi:phosphatidylserine/phosphatidylglycerophosphate/cardiolipin synthase-like enzyme